MIQREMRIINKLGLHARAASKFVATASRFSSAIQVTKDGNTVNGKSIMGVLMLAAAIESILTLEVDGDDEAQAMEALETLIMDKFGEDE